MFEKYNYEDEIFFYLNRIFYIKGMKQDMNNFIKFLDPRDGREIGFVAMEKGSDLEADLIDRFLDSGLHFEKATESYFVNYKEKYTKRVANAVFCTEFPMEEE